MNNAEHQIQNQSRFIEQDDQRSGDFFGMDPDVMEAGLLENINSTPLGRLLKIISTLPEVRQQKVIEIRRQIDHGQYDVSENLDEALDRVLEEFIAE